jgi:LPPG:FO 2-phospho-L-lactate transferase
VLESLEAADAVVFCPSNPFVSLDPILSVPGIREALARRPAIAVSPIIGGKAIKGPAAKMFQEMGVQPSPMAVARHFDRLLRGIIIDCADSGSARELEEMGLRVRVLPTLMKSSEDRRRLAEGALALAVGAPTRAALA